ncbi:MAG: hypothetical protein QXJ74_06110 [Nitrososphaera sp.]
MRIIEHTGKKKVTPQDKQWLLRRTEHFISLYEDGKMEPSQVCYEIYTGFIRKQVIPETVEEELKRKEGKKR